jgi:hypothetical protein
LAKNYIFEIGKGLLEKVQEKEAIKEQKRKRICDKKHNKNGKVVRNSKRPSRSIEMAKHLPGRILWR